MQELEILEKRVSVYRNRCQRHVAQLQEHAHALKNEIGITRAGMYKATAKADEVYLDISTYKNDSKYLQERIARWDQLISRISTDEPIWKEQGLQYFIELELNQKMIEEKYEVIAPTNRTESTRFIWPSTFKHFTPSGVCFLLCFLACNA